MVAINTLLAAVCIVLGILVGADAFEFLFPPLDWFVLAIAFNTLAVGYTVGRKA